jgi:hypothetical protein
MGAREDVTDAEQSIHGSCFCLFNFLLRFVSFVLEPKALFLPQAKMSTKIALQVVS